MLMNRRQSLMWRRQVFVRNPHPDLNRLFDGIRGRSGIYMIGCANEIVYVGQAVDLAQRPIESLGRYYHRVPDVSLPWSLALAPCLPDEMHERESTAIRAFAPRFNTSIPSIPQSLGRMPEIIGHASVFYDQLSPGGAFEPSNHQSQMERAAADPNPPWRQGKKRRKRTIEEPVGSTGLDVAPMAPSKQLQGNELKEVRMTYGLSLRAKLKYPINLRTDGAVITVDGEYLGTWGADQYLYPSFTPDGASVPLLQASSIGWLCYEVSKWHNGEPDAE